MFASLLFDAENEARTFCDRIEQLLRQGQPDQALAELEDAMAQLEPGDHPLAGLIVDAAEAHVEVVGWGELGARIAALGTADAPITAIGIDMSNTCHNGGEPDENGLLEPYIETSFYKDDAFPFSTASRAALLEAYQGHGTPWQGCFADIDGTIAIHGLDALYGALETRAGEDGDGLDQDLLLIGQVYMAIRIHLAVVEAVLHGGLPRPLTVLVGSNEHFPYFDAPVVTADEYRQFAPHQADDHEDEIEIEAEAPEEEAAFEEELALVAPVLEYASAEAETDEEALHMPDPAHHEVSGKALRRLAQQSDAAAAALEPQEKPAGLIGRLLRRK